MKNNPIMIALREAGLEREKPMTPINTFKFLEELMEKKYKSDLKDISDRREPRVMTEFLMEHLQRVFGIAKLALRHLSQLVPAMKALHDDGNEYATFYCRLFQLYHPNPIPYQLALFLTKARIIFTPLIEKYEKSILFQKKTKLSKTKENIENLYSGGFALISDAIDLIYIMFSNDRESGVQVLEHLKPPTVSDEEFVTYKICHRMSKLGKTSEGIFGLLDRDGGGTLDSTEFSRGTVGALDLWISQRSIKAFFDKIDTTKRGEINKDQFMKFINIKILQECNRSERFLISKSTFLGALVEVYMTRQKKDAIYLDQNVPKDLDDISQARFSEIILGYNKTVTPEKLVTYYNDAKALSDDGTVKRPALIRVMLRNTIGKYGIGPFMLTDIADIYKEERKQNRSSVNVTIDNTEEKKSNRRPRMSSNISIESQSPINSSMFGGFSGLLNASNRKSSRDNSFSNENSDSETPTSKQSTPRGSFASSKISVPSPRASVGAVLKNAKAIPVRKSLIGKK